MGRLARLLAALALLALAAAAGGAATAQARTYEVVACDAAPDGANRSWTARSTSPYLAAYTQCPAPAAPGQGGLVTRNSPQAGARVNPAGAVAAQVFRAPAGTAVVGLTWAGWRLRRGDARGLEYEVGVRDDGGRWLDARCSSTAACAIPTGPASVGFERIARHSVAVARRRSIAFVTRCRGLGGRPCDSRSTGDRSSGYLAAGIMATYARVRIDDDASPAIGRPAGPLWARRVGRGRRAVRVTATDGSGIRSVRLLVDDTVVARARSRCDRTRPAPCPARYRGELPVDTRRVGDRRHRVVLRVTDAAGNVSVARRTIAVGPGAGGGGGAPTSWRTAALVVLGLVAALAALTAFALLRRRRRRARPAPMTMEEVRARIAEMRAAGMTPQQIADRLNAERVPTLLGRGAWRPAGVEMAERLRPSPRRGAAPPAHRAPSDRR